MNATNRRLLIVALLLLGLSAMTHWNMISRADRFERGQKLLPNLNPDEIAAMEIRSGEDGVTLRREGDRFVIVEENGYRAKNEEVNRLVRDLQDVTLDKRVGTGDALAEELGLGVGNEPSESASGGPEDAAQTSAGVEVVLRDSAGEDMVRLEIGASVEDGGGTYLRRTDGEDNAIYIAGQAPRPAATPERFLDSEILDVASSEIARVEAADFILARAEEGSDLELTEVPAGRRAKSVEVNKVKNLLSRLRFEDVFVADHADVRDLRFEDALRYDLTDGSGYVIQTAAGGERTFLRVSGFHTVDRVEITMETTEAEMEEKSDTLHRADEIQAFNADHGSWVYEVEPATAEKLALRKSALLETS